MQDPNAMVLLRELCDHHAARLAKRERKIAKLNVSFQRALHDHITERVELERQQCELLLKLEKEILHGQRTYWKQELASSLMAQLPRSRFSVTGIEERLTAARAAAADPSYWVRMAALMHEGHGLNFRKGHKALQKPEEDEEQAAVTGEPLADDDDGDEGEDERDDTEDAIETPPAGAALAPEVHDVLDESDHLDDAELTVEMAHALSNKLKAARAEIERLKAENESLKAEIMRLRTSA